ncbi:hypothetical protein ACLB2K_051075 [Fragaria x ananassa]
MVVTSLTLQNSKIGYSFESCLFSSLQKLIRSVDRCTSVMSVFWFTCNLKSSVFIIGSYGSLVGRAYIYDGVLKRTSEKALKCERPSVLHRPATTTARLHPSGFQQRPRPLSLPGEFVLFQFPVRSPKTPNKVDLAGKLEFGGLVGEGK